MPGAIPGMQTMVEDGDTMSDNCCCNSKVVVAKTDKTVLVEYMYLDLEVCTRCIDNMYILERALYKMIPTLALAGYKVDLRRIEIIDEESAKKHHFLSSPTIRVNGHDICAKVAENECDCCKDICGTDVNCRVFEYDGIDNKVDLRRIEIIDEESAKKHHFLSSPTIRVNGHDICAKVAENECDCCKDICGTDVNCRVFEYDGIDNEVVPEAMIIDGLMKYASYELAVPEGDYVLSDNLKKFFEGKRDNAESTLPKGAGSGMNIKGCKTNLYSSMCNCPSKTCKRKGNCCECVNFHRYDEIEKLPYCFRSRWVLKEDME